MKGRCFCSRFRAPLLCSSETRKRAFAEIFLTVLGFCLWGAAMALLFGGAFVILTYQSYKVVLQNPFFPLPAYLAVIAAFLLFLTGALAMYIPVKNSRNQQGTLMYLLVILFCLEASSAVVTQLYTTQAASQLTHNMYSLFHLYNRLVPNYSSNEVVDEMQEQLNCCGIYNYTDWHVLALPNHPKMGSFFAPKSCCKKGALDCTDNENQWKELFEEGCLQKLEKRLYFVRYYIHWCCIIVGCLEILTLISNGVLMKEQPFQDFRILDSAAFS